MKGVMRDAMGKRITNKILEEELPRYNLNK
jgi:hypothetical protein